MNEEFDTYPTMPDFDSLLHRRIVSKSETTSEPSIARGPFDPYQTMLQRKKNETSPIDPATIQKWPEEDTKALEDYCTKMGIVGISTRINPKFALMQLKRQLGDYGGGIPEGYEKIGITNKYGPNYPYTVTPENKKVIIHG